MSNHPIPATLITISLIFRTQPNRIIVIPLGGPANLLERPLARLSTLGEAVPGRIIVVP